MDVPVSPPCTIFSLCRLQKNLRVQPHVFLSAAPGEQETEVAHGTLAPISLIHLVPAKHSWRERNRKEGRRSKCIPHPQSWSWTQQHQFAASFVKLVNEAPPTEYPPPVLYFWRVSVPVCLSTPKEEQRISNGGRGERSIGSMFFSFST